MDPAADLRDGEALCQLVLAHRPNMLGVQAALGKLDPEQRLAAFFATVHHQLCVPELLDCQATDSFEIMILSRFLTKPIAYMYPRPNKNLVEGGVGLCSFL